MFTIIYVAVVLFTIVEFSLWWLLGWIVLDIIVSD